ncbi:testis-expressed protein 11 isoform X1 [Tachysurus fulvidraco]|uniref:testis-expressed protein 11 isoform X1 n=1 Tax=Tachysurus fulvidraco TaxID=1234273 RepID=UPI001FEFBAA7|nr:testis-expressed protein 11 isoform X1 [Tachysurus fulvidraco]
MELFSNAVKDLLEKLLHSQRNETVSECIEKLFDKVESPEKHTKIQDSQVEEYVLRLWNWAVTKNVGSAINEQQRAKVRHIACRLLYLCEPEKPSENTIRKQILMAIKTGRTWLDCKNPKLADDFLSQAVTSLETLYCRLISQRCEVVDSNLPKVDTEKDLLRVLSYKAESALAQENQQEAVSCVDRCKEMLLRLPKETGYLSLICYKFGVDTYNKNKLEDSSFWLSQSYDIGKMNPKYSQGPEMQAKVLRLLARVYLELDCQKYQDKALYAVSLANKEYLEPAGIYLKIRILLKSGTADEGVKSGLKELLDSEVQLDVCLSTVKLLIAEDRETLAFDFLNVVCQHFESSSELGSALVLHIELLMLRGKELLGKMKIEDAITGHYTGRQLSPHNLTSLHLLLWDKAAKSIEAKNYHEALQWYNYSISFYKSGELDQNLAKLQRNRASCFLYLQQLDMAKDTISEALKCDPNSIFTHFSIYKIAVMDNNIEKAVEAIGKIGVLTQMPVPNEDRLLVTENAAANLLILAAQIALDNKQQETAVKALERFCELSHDVVQVITALRCLVRLLMSTMENVYEENRHIYSFNCSRNSSLDALFLYLKMALKNVSQLRKAPGQGEDFCSDEANWFRRIAWNTALQCESSSVRMRDFFLLCYQLSQHCVQDRGVLMGQKTCLLMVTAACLDICCMTPQNEQQAEILTQALEHIQVCTEIWRALKTSGDYTKDPTDTILLLYEFEARAKLNDPKLETVLESILELDNVDTKILETVAAIAMKPPAHFPVVCKKALSVALSLHKQDPQADLARCCYCLHTLIQLSLPSGVCEVDPRILEEAWGYYEEALSIISAASEDFPELEILWLLTRAWNTGILLYSLSQYTEAEKWCGLGISFLQHLGSMQDSYQTQMSGLYSVVLDRLDKAKKNHIMEE